MKPAEKDFREEFQALIDKHQALFRVMDDDDDNVWIRVTINYKQGLRERITFDMDEEQKPTGNGINYGMDNDRRV